ncbi:TetR/AcrR family transcriptional regulator [Psychrosphaera sp. 1_MG-2023]|nr:TetR/AcrR family transcriptional regulator [Psychrosphaera sp. 1_MG-2023]MDO6720810.1 TetR/AcrR family transcriptional regulator [Psychrosphaera sp. 1_MG-2023]
MEMKKAKSQQQKLDRTNSIIDAAEQLFKTNKGELPSASQIATAAGIAKGTVYIYFTSKEAIFLTLLERHIQKWLQDIARKMQQFEENNLDDICQFMLEYWQQEPTLGQLYRISDAMLEPKVDDKFHFGFQTRKVNEFKRLVPTFKELNPDVTAKEWNALLQRSLALIATAWVLSKPHSDLGADKHDFTKLATSLLTPFWEATLSKVVTLEKPKSGWRKLLGN